MIKNENFFNFSVNNMQKNESKNAGTHGGKYDIYLVATKSQSIPSRIIGLFTRERYTHISLSLHKNLRDMYSFGRETINNPFNGGIVKDAPCEGIYKKFPKTEATVIKISLKKEQFLILFEKLEDMFRRRKLYHYDYLGILLAFFHKRWQRKYYYYCSEFVKQLLVLVEKIPAYKKDVVMRPSELFYSLKEKIIYRGKLNDYPAYISI